MSDEKAAEEKAAEPAPESTEGMPAGYESKKTHVLHQWKHDAPLITCRFTPNGKYVFSSSEDISVQRWEYPTGQRVLYKGHESWVRDIVVLPDSQTVITVGCDEHMFFWPVEGEQPQPTKKIKAHNGWVRCAEVSPAGDLVATGGNDHLVKLWNAEDGSCIQELSGHDSHVYSVMFHPSGEFVLSGDLSGKVRQWETSTGKLVRELDAKELHTYNGGQQVHFGGVRSLSITADGKQLLCGGLYKASNPLGAVSEPLVNAYGWEDQKKTQAHISDGVRGGIYRSIALPNGTHIAASGGSGGGFLIFWKPGEEKSFHKFKLPDTLRGCDIHPDGLELATAHFDRHLRISRMTEKAAS